MRFFSTSLTALCFLLFLGAVTNAKDSFAAKEERYIVVIEESFYVVKPENKERFLEIYRTRLFPFWNEIYKMGLTTDEYRMYSQRIHTIKPLWTYKTIVKFKNYKAIDTWLEIRDKVYDRLFPGEGGGYKAPRKQIDLLTEKHWDEFIREVKVGK